jgi:preprotein translocase subunit Sec63
MELLEKVFSDQWSKNKMRNKIRKLLKRILQLPRELEEQNYEKTRRNISPKLNSYKDPCSCLRWAWRKFPLWPSENYQMKKQLHLSILRNNQNSQYITCRTRKIFLVVSWILWIWIHVIKDERRKIPIFFT